MWIGQLPCRKSEQFILNLESLSNVFLEKTFAFIFKKDFLQIEEENTTLQTQAIPGREEKTFVGINFIDQIADGMGSGWGVI